MMSSGATSSSMLSMTMPKLEYSRILGISRRLAPKRGMGPPSRRKAMILRVSGSTIALATRPIVPLACTLRTGVPISLLA